MAETLYITRVGCGRRSHSALVLLKRATGALLRPGFGATAPPTFPYTHTPRPWRQNKKSSIRDSGARLFASFFLPFTPRPTRLGREQLIELPSIRKTAFYHFHHGKSRGATPMLGSSLPNAMFGARILSFTPHAEAQQLFREMNHRRESITLTYTPRQKRRGATSYRPSYHLSFGFIICASDEAQRLFIQRAELCGYLIIPALAARHRTLFLSPFTFFLFVL